MKKYVVILIVVIIIGILLSCSVILKDKNSALPLEKRVEELLSKMTLEEKIALTHANTKFTLPGVERLGIPQLSMSDGPHGVREEVKPHVWESAGWTTDSASYFPTGTALAATWNPELAYQFGIALGQEARARKKDVILGPGINIMRTPLCGRNFEYMGEDPYLISQMVVPYIKGVQEQDVAACLKHFALNNQEYERHEVDVIVGEQALREIYLPGYEAAVKGGGVLTVMTGYNKFRGNWCAENKYLLNDILKSEWGFKGVVMSDWNGTHSTVASAVAGLDVEMGTEKENYDDWYFARPLLRAVQSGEVSRDVLDDKVRRILRVMVETNMLDTHRSQGSFTTPEHFKIARKVAEESVVLLRNEQGLLPLDQKKIKSIAVIGDNAIRKHAREGGSSGIKAIYEITPLQGLREKLGDHVQLNVVQGYERSTEFTWDRGVIDTFNAAVANKLRGEAVEAAKNADVAIIFGGLNHDFDCEGWDRKEMKLPYEQDKLISEIRAVNPKTIVVLVSGAPVEMPWVDKVPAIVQAWYAGMEGGNVLADVLFGDVNPSGKLTFTFPRKLSDSPAHDAGNYPGENHQVKYDEGILVGYRYFDTKNVQPLFPFGYGLSYTQFKYSELRITKAADESELPLKVTFKLQNTGDRPGAETAQLYISDVAASVQRPAKELKAFAKIYLQPGEEREVTLNLKRDAFAFYNVETSSWKTEPGIFKIFIGSSSRDLRLEREVRLIH